jgi:hypothetical protein
MPLVTRESVPTITRMTLALSQRSTDTPFSDSVSTPGLIRVIRSGSRPTADLNRQNSPLTSLSGDHDEAEWRTAPSPRDLSRPGIVHALIGAVHPFYSDFARNQWTPVQSSTFDGRPASKIRGRPHYHANPSPPPVYPILWPVLLHAPARRGSSCAGPSQRRQWHVGVEETSSKS